MSNSVTNKELQVDLTKQTDEIVSLLRDFIFQVDERFNQVEKGVTDLKESHNRLLNTIDCFI